MKKKQVILIALSFVLAIALSIGGTVAYLTATDDAKLNVFTIGDVTIDLTEYADINGDANDPRLEAKYVDGENEPYGYVYHRVMPGDKLTKRVSVTNTSGMATADVLDDKDAYVRVTVTINNADLLNRFVDEVYEAEYGKNSGEVQAMYDLIFDGWGVNYMPRTDAGYAYNDARGIIDDYSGIKLDAGSKIFAVDFAKTTDYDKDYYNFGLSNWFKSANEMAASTYTAFPPSAGYYTAALENNADTNADERDYKIVYTYYLFLEAGDTATLFEGLNVPADFNNEQIQLFQDLEIAVEANAIQADHFDDPYLAFAALANGGRAFPTIVAKNADELNAALAAAKAGTTINLVEGVNYGTITLGTLDNVTLVGADNARIILKTTDASQLNDITFKGINFVYDGTAVDFGIVVAPNAKIDNLVVSNCTFTGTGAKAGRGVSGYNNAASITLSACTFQDLGYPIYAWGGYASLTVDTCVFDNIKSWAIMPQSGFNGDLTVINNEFVDCAGGLIKAGTMPADKTFTFTDNTVINNTVSGDHNWFQFNVTAANTVISGNVKDGADWIPNAADGLKQ